MHNASPLLEPAALQRCSRRAAVTSAAQEARTCLRLVRPPVDEQGHALLPAAAAQHAVAQASIKHSKLSTPRVDQEAALRGVRLGAAQPVVVLLIHNDGRACSRARRQPFPLWVRDSL